MGNLGLPGCVCRVLFWPEMSELRDPQNNHINMGMFLKLLSIAVGSQRGQTRWSRWSRPCPFNQESTVLGNLRFFEHLDNIPLEEIVSQIFFLSLGSHAMSKTGNFFEHFCVYFFLKFTK